MSLPFQVTSNYCFQVEYEYLELEPIGVTFMVFFALVMLIQVIGMILHRILTLSHIVVTTKLW